MMPRPVRQARILFAVGLFGVIFGPNARADVKLPRLIGDHMVLQRDMPIRVWGWAAPGEKVAVALDKHQGETQAGPDGAWQVELPAMRAGGPYEMTVAGHNRLTIKDILVGEVWICSGQSNMEWGLVVTRNHDKEIAAADYPKMRLSWIPKRSAEQPCQDVETQWHVCSPRTVSYFSAVAYYFGRELHRELSVPVGLIFSAVAGTRIEPWTPRSAVASVPELAGHDKFAHGDLYNGMIHPLTPLRIRGAIWYQGEGNVGDGMVYYHRMRAMINGWRAAWGEGDFPFYYVQIAPLNWGGKPVDQQPAIWEAQTAALKIPNTGMAVTNDIGNIGDAHPRNKLDVGKRLALWALAKTYGKKDLAYSGPLYRSMKVEGGKVRITFDFAEGGLAARDGKPLTWFTVAGEDRKFAAARAEIDGESVVVWNEAVKTPVAVRFAWHQVAEPNLINRHGLPASAFRTDAW